jgi:hypothetical protein
MELEYRVFKGNELIFRSVFTTDEEDDAQISLLLSVSATQSFQAKHSDIDLRDASITTMWCDPDMPLPSLEAP